MRILWCILCVFSFCAEASFLGKPASYFLEVESTYTDEANKKDTTIKATGFTALYNGKLYAITSAHVSQGKQTALKQASNKLEILGRLADNTMDIEVMELPVGSAKPVVNSEKKYLTRSFAIDQSLVGHEKALNLDMVTWAVVPAGLAKQPKGRPEFIHETVGGEVLIANMQAVPGMSGSMVFVENAASGVNEAQGVITSYLRDFDQTYIVPINRVVDLLEKYEKGERGIVGDTTWSMREGNTYRKFSDKLTEIPSGLRPAGNAETADGGNAETADGGNIVGGVPQSGVLYDGKHVVGFLVKDKETKKLLPIYGNSVGAMLPDHFPERYELVKPVTAGETLAVIGQEISPENHLQVDKNTKPEHVVTVMTAKSGSQLYKSMCLTEARSRMYAARQPEDMIEVKNDRISLRVIGCDGDILLFDLDRQGRLIGQENRGFQSVLKLKGSKTNRQYSLDIKGLFFTDVMRASDISQADGFRIGKDKDRAESQKNFFKSVQQNAGRATLMLKEPKTDIAIPLKFSVIDGMDIVRFFRLENGKYFWDEFLTSKPVCNP